jgi:hypothetical protein
VVNAEKPTNEMVRRNLRLPKRSPFEELAEAYQYIGLNKQVGKIVLTLGKQSQTSDGPPRQIKYPEV